MVGLLLVSYVFWLLGTLGFLANNLAGVLLALADDIEERCPRGAPVDLRCHVSSTQARVDVQGLAGWRPRAIAERFERIFGRTLVVEAV